MGHWLQERNLREALLEQFDSFAALVYWFQCRLIGCQSTTYKNLVTNKS